MLFIGDMIRYSGEVGSGCTAISNIKRRSSAETDSLSRVNSLVYFFSMVFTGYLGTQHYNSWYFKFHSRPHWNGIGQPLANEITLMVAHYLL